MNLFLAIFGKIIAAVIGLYYVKILPPPYRLFLCQVLLAIVLESCGFYIGAIKHHNNIWVFNCFTWLFLWLIGIAFLYFVPNKIVRYFFLLMLAVGTSIWFVSLYIEGIYILTISGYVYEYFCLLLFSFYVLVSNLLFQKKMLLSEPLFWLCISTLIFYGGGLPFWGLFNYINTTHRDVAKSLYSINKVLNFIAYPLVGVGFYLYGKQNASASADIAG